MIIADKNIGEKHEPFIIAEVGINHNGDIELAKKTILKAKECGASAVKLQTFRAKTLCLQAAPYYNLFEKCEFSESQIQELNEFCKNLNINIFSAVFDEWAINLWSNLNTIAIKIASGDITHIPLLKHAASKGFPMIVSTGGASDLEIKNAVKAIKSVNNNLPISLLHCISNYPTNISDLNLNCIREMKENYKIPIGFSDHTIGISASISAVAIGADLIEKHFTLDKNLEGPDHKLSSDPKEFKELVQGIRIAFKARGNDRKKVVEHTESINAMRRSVTSSIDIAKGTKIEKNMLVIRRPGDGIQPIDIEKIIGLEAKINIKSNKTIYWDDII
jgi:N-acetylneuraminate synthase/N,N'-diacetyllegionaminate synthase